MHMFRDGQVSIKLKLKPVRLHNESSHGHTPPHDSEKGCTGRNHGPRSPPNLERQFEGFLFGPPGGVFWDGMPPKPSPKQNILQNVGGGNDDSGNGIREGKTPESGNHYKTWTKRTHIYIYIYIYIYIQYMCMGVQSPPPIPKHRKHGGVMGRLGQTPYIHIDMNRSVNIDICVYIYI